MGSRVVSLSKQITFEMLTGTLHKQTKSTLVVISFDFNVTVTNVCN